MGAFTAPDRERYVRAARLHLKQTARLAAGWVAMMGVLFLGVVLLSLRFSLEADHALRMSDREFDQGRLRESLLFARRAGYLMAPRLRHLGRAMARLDAIAVGAEAAGRREIAVLAWQSIRSIGTLTPIAGRPAERLALANQRLATLLADDGRRSSMVETEQLSRRVFRALQRRRTDSGPVVGAFLVVLLGTSTAYLGWGGERRARLALWVGCGLAGLGSIGWAILLSSS